MAGLQQYGRRPTLGQYRPGSLEDSLQHSLLRMQGALAKQQAMPQGVSPGAPMPAAPTMLDRRYSAVQDGAPMQQVPLEQQGFARGQGFGQYGQGLGAAMPQSAPPVQRDQYGLARALGTGNIQPGGSLPGAIGTLAGGSTVANAGGRRLVMGPNVAADAIGTLNANGPGAMSSVMRMGQRSANRANQENTQLQSYLAKNYAARQAATAQKRADFQMAKSGLRGANPVQPAAAPAATSLAGGFQVPTPDVAAPKIAATNSAPWSIYGVQDFQGATPQQMVSALRTPEWMNSSAEGKAARIAELQNHLARQDYANSPYAPELMALMSGQTEGANIERSLRANQGNGLRHPIEYSQEVARQRAKGIPRLNKKFMGVSPPPGGWNMDYSGGF